MRTNNYVILIVQTDKGRVWEVRKRGRFLWKTIGTFKNEREAVNCAYEDMGGDGGTLEWGYVDRRRRKGALYVWVLEYKTFRKGEFRKVREEFLTKWEAALHKWLYNSDSSILDMKIYHAEVKND